MALRSPVKCVLGLLRLIEVVEILDYVGISIVAFVNAPVDVIKGVMRISRLTLVLTIASVFAASDGRRAKSDL